jgi:GTPase SAR1 family protein
MKTIEIAFIGALSAGKTSLMNRCLGKDFHPGNAVSTIGIHLHSTTLVIGK